MRYTFYFGSYFGIPLRIHFTFPLILIAFGAEAWWSDGWRAGVWAVMLVLTVFVCVVLHEFGHSLQVRRYGIQVRDIILLPIGGMARAEKIPENPVQEIVVAISGPLVNFALAIVFTALMWSGLAPYGFHNEFLVSLMWINIVLGVFNLTPAFPMDGGRILRGLLATRMSYLKATRYARNVGQVIAILFAVVGFLSPKFIMLPLIGIFIFFGALGEERMVRIKVALEGKSAKDFLPQMSRMLTMDDTVETAAPRARTVDAFALPVTDERGLFAAAVETEDLRRAMESGRGGESLKSFIKTGFPLIDGDDSAIRIYHLLKHHRLPLAGIVSNNRYLGLIFYEDIARAIT